MLDIKRITEFNDAYLDVYARLSENQLLNRDKPEDGIFIAESPKVIERALNAGYEPISVLVEDKQIDGEAAPVLAMLSNTPVYTAEFDVLTQLTGFKLTRGMLCAMKRKPLADISEVISGAKRIAVLENIMNPTNIGAIIRSAAALNIDAVLITDDSSNPLYRRAIRVSMGTVFQIPWTIVSRENYLSQLKSAGFKTVAFALRNDSVSIKDEILKNEEKLAVILGSEGDGLAESTLDACDYTVTIPMSNGVDSLNVAACSAVAFWMLGNN